MASGQTDYINSILEFIIKKRGYDFKGYSFDMLGRRIQKRIKHYNCNTHTDYLEILYSKETEVDALVDKITINVSVFFRDPLMYEILSSYLIPDILNNKKNNANNQLRIWSAACSEGQEPYSMAIICSELLVKEKQKINLSIFATDIDGIVIRKAEKGTYDADDLSDTKHKYILKYFEKSKNQYTISETIKNKVNFSVYDLLDRKRMVPPDSVYGSFDIVLCRNVLIYYNSEYQELIMEKLYNALSKNGVLILGDTEILSEKYRSKFNRIGNFSKLFRKS